MGKEVKKANLLESTKNYWNYFFSCINQIMELNQDDNNKITNNGGYQTKNYELYELL